MPIALDPSTSYDYTLKEEREREGPTVFELRSLTFRERTKIDRETYKVGKGGYVSVDWLRRREDLIRLGLVGWRNFRDAAGNEVTFDARSEGGPSDAALDRLSESVMSELVEAIQDQSGVSEKDQD